MQCQTCGNSNPQGAHHCTSCGQKLISSQSGYPWWIVIVFVAIVLFAYLIFREATAPKTRPGINLTGLFQLLYPPTPTPTFTSAPSNTPPAIPSRTATPSVTPTRTPEASQTHTPTRTNTPTQTPLPTPTYTITNTEPVCDAMIHINNETYVGCDICKGTLPTIIRVGMKAYVNFIPPISNRVRDYPSRSAVVIGSMEPGTIMTIIDGPVCDDVLIWWKIETSNGLKGWTAETDGKDYFFLPVR
jgi:hypothetical protein